MLRKLLTLPLVALAALATLALAFYAVGSLGWRPSRRGARMEVGEVRRGSGPLSAGAAVVPLELPDPVPVAGFARLLWASEGRRDPVAVRAVALSEQGCTVVFVSAELLLIPALLVEAVEERTRDLGVDRLLLAATHTHAGPGGFWEEPLGERLATGPYDEATFERVAAAIVEAVKRALAARAPASLAVARGEARDLVRNRHRGGLVDGRLVRVSVTAPGGAPLADLVLFPSHATMLGVGNRLLSGDWPGALMRGRAAPLLFFQGAVGDQSPLVPGGLPSTPESYAGLVKQRLEGLTLGTPEPEPELAVTTSTVVLPAPVPGAAPPPLRRLLANLFYDLVPSLARISAVRLGPLTLVAVPGEPVAEVGRRWREAAGEDTELLALAGDYLGYIETSERMAEAAGETVRTYYGPELASRLAGAVRAAAKAVKSAPAAPVGDHAPVAQVAGAEPSH